MSEEDLFDKLRGRKYVYLVTAGTGASNANVLAYDEAHARRIGKKHWSGQHDIKQCDEVTESFRRLNNTFGDADADKLKPGILSIRFLGTAHIWITT